MPGTRSRKTDLMTVEQVADYLQLNKLTVYKYIRDGRLPAARLGKAYRIRLADVDAFLERQMLRSGPRRPARVPAVRAVGPGAAATRVPAMRAAAPGAVATRAPAARAAAPHRGVVPAEVAVGPVRRESPREREHAEMSINPMEWVIRGLH